VEQYAAMGKSKLGKGEEIQELCQRRKSGVRGYKGRGGGETHITMGTFGKKNNGGQMGLKQLN